MAEALAFAADGKVKADIELQPLSDINDIFDRLKHGKVAGRVVLDFVGAGAHSPKVAYTCSQHDGNGGRRMSHRRYVELAVDVPGRRRTRCTPWCSRNLELRLNGRRLPIGGPGRVKFALK